MEALSNCLFRKFFPCFVAAGSKIHSLPGKLHWGPDYTFEVFKELCPGSLTATEQLWGMAFEKGQPRWAQNAMGGGIRFTPPHPLVFMCWNSTGVRRSFCCSVWCILCTRSSKNGERTPCPVVFSRERLQGGAGALPPPTVGSPLFFKKAIPYHSCFVVLGNLDPTPSKREHGVQSWEVLPSNCV